MKYLVWIKVIISRYSNSNFSINSATPHILGSDIFSKWAIFVDKTNIILRMKNNKVLESCHQIVIYSINAYNIIEEITKIINLLLVECYEEELIKYNINKALIENNVFSISKFEAYDAVVFDRRYTIKKYNPYETADIPSGISTSYLNVNNEFESIGYFGYAQSTKRLYFFSVEERSETYIRTNNFEIFKINEDQVLYFILDFLNVLDQLKLYRIKLIGQSILFAVVKSSERWKFRVDDIGQFYYISKPKLYENHIFLMTVLEGLLLVIKNKETFDFMRDLIFAANVLKNKDYDYYIEILILKVEKRLNIH